MGARYGGKGFSNSVNHCLFLVFLITDSKASNGNKEVGTSVPTAGGREPQTNLHVELMQLQSKDGSAEHRP